jgi:hypothetical protein
VCQKSLGNQEEPIFRFLSEKTRKVLSIEMEHISLSLSLSLSLSQCFPLSSRPSQPKTPRALSNAKHTYPKKKTKKILKKKTRRIREVMDLVRTRGSGPFSATKLGQNFAGSSEQVVKFGRPPSLPDIPSRAHGHRQHVYVQNTNTYTYIHIFPYFTHIIYI